MSRKSIPGMGKSGMDRISDARVADAILLRVNPPDSRKRKEAFAP
jgi:hypothetical protein